MGDEILRKVRDLFNVIFVAFNSTQLRVCLSLWPVLNFVLRSCDESCSLAILWFIFNQSINIVMKDFRYIYADLLGDNTLVSGC